VYTVGKTIILSQFTVTRYLLIQSFIVLMFSATNMLYNYGY